MTVIWREPCIVNLAHLTQESMGKGTVSRYTATMRWLYRLVYLCLAAASLPHVLWLIVTRSHYRKHLGERWARYNSQTPSPSRRRGWIHAVSLGEMDVALTLIRTVQAEAHSIDFVLTTVTPEGRHLAELANLPNVALHYAPFDFVSTQRRAFEAFRPDLLVLVELELWPNQLWEANARRVPVAIVNGRLPMKELSGYRKIAWFIEPLFGIPSLVCAQSDLDAESFREMGARNVQVTGNIKFDAALAKLERSGDDLREVLGKRVLLGASTHPGEEEILLGILQKARTTGHGLLLVLAPRDVERAASIHRLAAAKGFRVALRSSLNPATGQDPPDVIVLDTIGELGSFCRSAELVFVGKSLTGRGGQNMIEPAAAGCAVLFGPHTENFAWVAEGLLQAEGGLRARDARDLENQILRLLADPAAVARLGDAARLMVAEHSGAAISTAACLAKLFDNK